MSAEPRTPVTAPMLKDKELVGAIAIYRPQAACVIPDQVVIEDQKTSMVPPAPRSATRATFLKTATRLSNLQISG